MNRTIAFLLLTAAAAFGQGSEHLKTQDSVGMVVARAAAAELSVIAENIRPVLPNIVHMRAWHKIGEQGCEASRAHTFYRDGSSAQGVITLATVENNESIIGYGCPFFDAWTHNLRTNAGGDAQASQMANTSTQAASCNYFGLAADSSNSGAGTIAATDTTLASSGTGSTELATNGLSRAQATYAHTTGTATFTLTHTFTDTTAQTAGINKTGVFNAASSGTMCFEALFTPVTLNVNDTLAETYTVNY